MKAATARELRIHARIRAAFGTAIRECVVTRIEWPHIWVSTRLRSGEHREVRHHYRGLYPIDGPEWKDR